MNGVNPGRCFASRNRNSAQDDSLVENQGNRTAPTIIRGLVELDAVCQTFTMKVVVVEIPGQASGGVLRHGILRLRGCFASRSSHFG